MSECANCDRNTEPPIFCGGCYHTLERERDEALDVLRELHDWQNGCPLPSYEKGWGAAMEWAKKLFKKHGV